MEQDAAAPSTDPREDRVRGTLSRRGPSVPAAPERPTDPLPPRERAVEPASGLAVTSLTLGGLAVLLGATLVWFFLALPFGLVAVGCALLERRRTRRATGRAAGGVVTAGMVLGLASVPLALGGLVVIPQAQDFLGESVRDANGVVAEDLDSLERSLRRNVDALDRTLSENVDQSTQSLSEDFTQLEASSQAELEEAERQLRDIVGRLESTTRADLAELEASVSADIQAERQIIAEVEAQLRQELDAARAEIERVEGRLGAPEP